MHSVGKTHPRILLVYREIIPSVAISALRPLQALMASGEIVLEHTSIKSKKAEDLLLWCDVVVCSRNCFGDGLPFQLKLRQLNIPYIYDCDDNFLRLRYVNDPSVAYLRWPGSMESVISYMRHAAAIKVGSQQLAEDCYQYNTNSVLQRYCVDIQSIEDVCIPRKNSSDIMIGYAGSITHILDINIVVDSIQKVMNDYPNVSFICYGVDAPGIKWNPRATFIPYIADYNAFLQDFASRGIDIAIAPLYDTVVNRSKTNNKYREYSACGIAGIYSDMPVYNQCIHHGVNGLLCENEPKAWETALRRLITDHDLRKSIAANARQDILMNYSLTYAAKEWMSGLLLPAMERISSSVAYADRDSVLAHGQRQRLLWLREQFTSSKDLLMFWMYVVYTRLKSSLKQILQQIGLLTWINGKRSRHLSRRLHAINQARESGHESK